MKQLVLRLFFLLFIVIFITGCAMAPKPRLMPTRIANSKGVSKPFDAVWIQLIEYLSSRQIQLKMINKESGFIDTEFMSLPGEIVADYAWTGGNLPSMLHPEGRIKANIFVKKISDFPYSQTTVTVNTSAQVFETYNGRFFPGGWFDAKSTGKLESEILNTLR